MSEHLTIKQAQTMGRPRAPTYVGCLEKRSRSAAFSLPVVGKTSSPVTSDMSLISRTHFPSDSSVLA